MFTNSLILKTKVLLLSMAGRQNRHNKVTLTNDIGYGCFREASRDVNVVCAVHHAERIPSSGVDVLLLTTQMQQDQPVSVFIAGVEQVVLSCLSCQERLDSCWVAHMLTNACPRSIPRWDKKSPY